MAKNNNVIEEIQELIQQIKNEYQEGVDYKFVTGNEAHKRGSRWVEIISSRLKKYLREKFNFPTVFNDYLDYQRKDEGGNWFTYRTNKDTTKYDDWDSILFSEGCKKDTSQEGKPKDCAVCDKLAFKENGRMKLWDGKKVTNEPSPNVLGYLHPECAKKYFAGKEQPKENNNSQIKEKILRNLDKICLDPIGYLANAEVVKGDIEKDYGRGSKDPIWNELHAKIHKVEVEGEEIDLVKLEREVKLSVRKAIINEIKQNPSEWKIESSSVYAQPSQNIPDSFKILRHKSGRRHWNVGIIYLNESLEKGKKDWTEIEVLVKGQSTSPDKKHKNQPSKWGEKQIIEYFLRNNIRTIILDGDNLIIKHNGGEEENAEVNNLQLQLIKEIVAQQKNHSLAFSDLQPTTNSPQSNLNRHQLAISLAIGASVVLVVGMVVYFVRRKRKINKL